MIGGRMDPSEEIKQLQTELAKVHAELADARFEIEGCHNTINKLSSEIRRLRERYHIAAEGDR